MYSSQKLLLTVFSTFLLNINADALNLTEHEVQGRNSFFEILDVEPFGNGGLLTSGVDGLHLLEYRNEQVLYTSSFRTPVGFNVRAHEDVCLVAHRYLGATFVDISNRAEPESLLAFDMGFAIEDGIFVFGKWWLAAHGDGLVLIDLNNRERVLNVLEEDLENAWTLAMHPDSLVYIADGTGGVVVVGVDSLGNPEYLNRLETSGNAIDVKWNADRLVVAVGDAGFDVFNTIDPSEPEFEFNVDTPRFCNHVSVTQNRIAAADWGHVLVYNAENGNLVGSRYAHFRAMGVHISGDNKYLADWVRFRHFTLGQVRGPDIEIEPRLFNFSFVPEGDTLETPLTFSNSGGLPLSIQNMTSSSGAYSFSHDILTLDPGESEEVVLQYIHDPEYPGNTRLEFESDDFDEPVVGFQVTGHGASLSIGDPAPPFGIPTLEGPPFELTSHLGEVVLIAFFTTW